jgi:drug/metabolite transporter (DMT)-like permease
VNNVVISYIIAKSHEIGLDNLEKSFLQGLVASGVSLSLQIWCIDRGGALFTAIFQPVQTVMVAIMAAVILGDELYTGG